MRAPSALSTSIMLSLFIIVAGAMLIIFIQIDRGYKLPNYYQEQNDIIRQTYLKETSLSNKARAATVTPQAPPVKSVEQKKEKPETKVAIAEQISTLVTAAKPAPTPKAETSYSRQAQNYIPYDILLDSPWSPYYQPLHFENMR